MLLYFSIFFLLILGYVLFAPFFIEINSITGFYGIRFHRLASARVEMTGLMPTVSLSIIGWEKHISIFKKGSQKTNRPIPIKKASSRKIPISMVKHIVKSFRLTKCHVDIDTGNCMLNGQLYPICYWFANHFGLSIRINFVQTKEIVLEVKNSFINILIAIIQSKLKQKYHGKSK